MASAMVVLMGTFDLREGTSEDAFNTAFREFSIHLREKSLLSAWRFGSRAPHSCYDNRPPAHNFWIEMTFADQPTADSCYAYVRADEEPLRTLHRAVNTKVVANTTSFALYKVSGHEGTTA